MGSQKSIPIKQARELARIISEQYQIKNYKDWCRFITGDVNIVLPTGAGKSFLVFELARKHVHSLKLKNIQEWKIYCNENHIVDIPSYPAKHYKNDWISWSDFLGQVSQVPSKFLSYEDARLFVQNIEPRITNCKEWDKYCKSGKRPKNIPHSPQKIYKGKWIGWNYFFGVGLYRPDVEEGRIFSDAELRDDIEFDINNIGSMEENFREEFDTDKEILEAYKDEPPEFLAALKQFFEDHPRKEE